MKATYLLKQNITALLRARGQTRHDLAMWCRRSDAWISKLMSDENRNVPVKYFDRIADFFGIATYQLFQPGISPLTERRHGGDRRSGRDRRVSHLTGQIHQALSPASAQLAEADIADLIRLRMLTEASRAEIRRDIEALYRAEREAAARGRGRRGAQSEPDEAKSRVVPGSRRPRRSTEDEG